MTSEMYHSYFREYENDPDLLMSGQEIISYVYSDDRVNRYIQRQRELKRIPLAILCDGIIVGEILIKNIETNKRATMSITLKKAAYKDHGIGTQAERLAVQYVFYELDIPVLYADTLQTNTRSQRVLERVGFRCIREDSLYKYYRIDRPGP